MFLSKENGLMKVQIAQCGSMSDAKKLNLTSSSCAVGFSVYCNVHLDNSSRVGSCYKYINHVNDTDINAVHIYLSFRND